MKVRSLRCSCSTGEMDQHTSIVFRQVFRYSDRWSDCWEEINQGRGYMGTRLGMVLSYRLVRESLAEKVTLEQRIEFSG